MNYTVHDGNSGRLLWWWVGPAWRDHNHYQPPGLSYVSDTALFSHECQKKSNLYYTRL